MRLPGILLVVEPDAWTSRYVLRYACDGPGQELPTSYQPFLEGISYCHTRVKRPEPRWPLKIVELDAVRPFFDSLVTYLNELLPGDILSNNASSVRSFASEAFMTVAATDPP